MPGLIEQVVHLGLEREELRKDHPGALIGGERIPYPPKDMASLVSILQGRHVNTYLALEASTDGAVRFLEAHLHIPEVTRIEKADGKEIKKVLRGITQPVDLISLDGRGLAMNAETLWRYIQGGRDSYTNEFGKGAPTDYGVPKLKPGGSLIVNLTDAAARDVWFKARSRYSLAYQSPFVGMVYVVAH